MGPLSKYFSDKAKINYGLSGPASKDIKLSDLKIVRSPLARVPPSSHLLAHPRCSRVPLPQGGPATVRRS